MTDAPVVETPFAAVSAVSSIRDGVFGVRISPAWTTNGGKPHGGYLLAMAARAAADVSAHDHVIAISGHFLRAPAPGSAEVHVEGLRSGRTTTLVRARLVQERKVCVEALVTLASLGAGTSPYWRGASRIRESLPGSPRSAFPVSRRAAWTVR